MTQASSPSTANTAYHPMGVTAVLLVLSTSLFWGGNSAAVKFSVDALPPAAVAAARFCLASLFLFVWCRWAGLGVQIDRKHVYVVVVGGLIQYLQIITFNIGVHWSNASHAAILVNAYVFFVISVDHFGGFGPRMTQAKWIGLMLAASGVAVVFVYSGRLGWSESNNYLTDLPSRKGDVMLLLSALVLSFRFLWTKKWVATIQPAKFTLWQFVVSVPLFAGTSWCVEQIDLTHVDVPTVGGILYQGLVVGGYCFTVQAFLLKRYSITQIAIFSFTTPLFGVAISMATRNDPLGPWLCLSVVLVAAGIFLVQRRQ